MAGHPSAANSRSELTDDEMRLHSHLERVCPICSEVCADHDDLMGHVNDTHLDYLTPETELMGFVDEDFKQSDLRDVFDLTPEHRRTDNNINLKSKTSLVNGGSSGVDGRDGSPLRSSLALELPKSSPRLHQCPMCEHRSSDPAKLEEHVNRQHFDPTSPSASSDEKPCSNSYSYSNTNATTTMKTTSSSAVHQCPLCPLTSSDPSELEVHVNTEHRDILSPGRGRNECPICGVELKSGENGTRHVDGHFASESAAGGSGKAREEREFRLLKQQYGMDDQGNYKEQSVLQMQRAVYAGEMTVSDYYEKQLEMRAAESVGADDGSSVTRGVLGKLRAAQPQALFCSDLDHYASSYGDRGWGCGYRNIQMMLSALAGYPRFAEPLRRMWGSPKAGAASPSPVPSILKLQTLIEEAWSKGFDTPGSEQLGNRLKNTRKWIGATEVVALLSSVRIRCQIIDFHQTTGPNGTHPALFNWVFGHFEAAAAGEFVSPLYLQHQGHSRTIVGAERSRRDGGVALYILDPSHSQDQMAAPSMRLLRKTESALKAPLYQIVAVIGTLDNEQQYQNSKVISQIRIP